MKNNKGFTLVELISILALIAIIATLSFQVVSTRIKKSKEKLRDTLYEEIEQAANKYLLDNPTIDKFHTSRLCIRISTLKDKGYLEKKEIKNPVNNESLSDYYVLAYYDNDSKQYKYDILQTQTCTSDTSSIISDDLVESKNLVVSSGQGLYEGQESYVFKGANPDNYLRFNNKLWRIISIDKETKNVKIMSTTSVANGNQENGIIEYLNASYDTSFSSSEKNFISTNSKWNTGVLDVDVNYNKTNVIKSLEKQKNSYYTVGLLSVSEYLDSFVGTSSYLNGDKIYFLSNRTSDNKIWIVNQNSLNKVTLASASTYNIYPVIYLNTNAKILGGSGTEQSPYKID